MWLLDTKTIQLQQFQNPAGLKYAILSHVWQTNEQSFQDIQAAYSGNEGVMRLSEKVRQCCKVARQDGFEWLWMDTCCIDKTSSSELSEAINSMYAWYANATICYAFLFDVDDVGDPRAVTSSFRLSKWFTRGWTLQELISPAYLVFLSSSWSILGTKHTLSMVIEDITGIPRDVLVHERSLDNVSVARRMSWASTRQTTREEDRAYSLMGIFGVHMPTIYGEGSNAFRRLQEEILRRSSDPTIFAWGEIRAGDPFSSFTYPSRDKWPKGTSPHYLLATSPSDFHNRTGISTLPHDRFASLLGMQKVAPPEFRLTSYGMRVQLPLLYEPLFVDDAETLCCAILACQDEQSRVGLLFLRLRKGTFGQCFVGTYADQIGILNLSYLNASNYWRIIFVSQEHLKSIAGECQLTDVDIHSFEPPSVHHVPTTLSAIVSTPPWLPPYAFFVPRYVFAKLHNQGIRLAVSDADDLTAQNGDGEFLIETPSPRAKTLTASFKLALAPYESRWSSYQIVSIVLSIGERCYQRGCFIERYQQLPKGVGTDSDTHHPGWLKIDVEAESPDQLDSPPVKSQHPLPFQGNAVAGCTYGHLPKSSSSELEFEDSELRLTVKLNLQLWEHCHRSRARLVYILDITPSGLGFPPKSALEIS